MIYQANKRQFGALEGLAHWCAEYYYTLERFGADDAEMPAIRKDMSFCMDRCDALGVPYWAQNAALAWAENWRATKSEYFDAAMAEEGSPAREVQRRDIIGSHYIDNIFCLQI